MIITAGILLISTHACSAAAAKASDPSSDRAQRIVDTLVSTLESEQIKAQQKQLGSEIYKSVSNFLQNITQNFVQKLSPDDAKSLLPLVSSAENIGTQLLNFASQSEQKQMTPAETQAAAQAVQMEAMMALMPYFAEYGPAFAKYQEKLKSSPAKNYAQEIDQAKKAVTELFKSIKSIIAKKA